MRLPPSPPASSPAVRARMQRMAGGRETRPEALLRSALWAMGLRFWKDRRPAPPLLTRADVVFPTERVCAFLDGCYWHACPAHYCPPKANAAWWAAKIARNVERDRRADEALADAGWLVVRAWEHEDPRDAARRVALAVAGQRVALTGSRARPRAGDRREGGRHHPRGPRGRRRRA